TVRCAPWVCAAGLVVVVVVARSPDRRHEPDIVPGRCPAPRQYLYPAGQDVCDAVVEGHLEEDAGPVRRRVRHAVSRSGPHALQGVRAVQVAVARHDVFVADESPVHWIVHLHCLPHVCQAAILQDVQPGTRQGPHGDAHDPVLPARHDLEREVHNRGGAVHVLVMGRGSRNRPAIVHGPSGSEDIGRIRGEPDGTLRVHPRRLPSTVPAELDLPSAHRTWLLASYRLDHRHHPNRHLLRLLLLLHHDGWPGSESRPSCLTVVGHCHKYTTPAHAV
ncbi:hypothetical protein PBRA_000422, partial [Plasmodiophora brassicae]